MTETTYTYSISGDTLNNKVASNNLTKEIQASEITIALEAVETSDDVLDIVFKDAISGTEKTTLDGIVSSHDGVVTYVTIPKDSDNAALSRVKVTRLGWASLDHSIEGETSVLNSGVDRDAYNQDNGFLTIKFFDDQGNELTTQETIDSNCVHTQFDWMPSYDFELIEGELRQKAVPSEDVRVGVIAAPNIPVANKGQVQFASNTNLVYLTENKKSIDGRAAKLMPHMGGIGSNLIRINIFHSAGFKHKLSFTFDHFRSV